MNDDRPATPIFLGGCVPYGTDRPKNGRPGWHGPWFNPTAGHAPTNPERKTVNIEFKNPPVGNTTARQVGAETQSIIEALRSRPGQWALIKSDVNPNTTQWWKKRPGIEARSSTIGKPKNKCDVYARWVGEDAA